MNVDRGLSRSGLIHLSMHRAPATSRPVLLTQLLYTDHNHCVNSIYVPMTRDRRTIRLTTPIPSCELPLTLLTCRNQLNLQRILSFRMWCLSTTLSDKGKRHSNNFCLKCSLRSTSNARHRTTITSITKI